MILFEKITLWSEDTFFRGSFCGLIAGIIKDVVDYIFFIFHLKPFVFSAFAAVVAFNKEPHNFAESLFALVLELIFSSFLGLLFAIIAQNLKTKYHLLLGVFYGGIIWFSIKAAILAFNITLLLKDVKGISPPIITWSLSMLYGFILAKMERRLSPKTN